MHNLELTHEFKKARQSVDKQRKAQPLSKRLSLLKNGQTLGAAAMSLEMARRQSLTSDVGMTRSLTTDVGLRKSLAKTGVAAGSLRSDLQANVTAPAPYDRSSTGKFCDLMLTEQIAFNRSSTTGPQGMNRSSTMSVQPVNRSSTISTNLAHPGAAHSTDASQVAHSLDVSQASAAQPQFPHAHKFVGVDLFDEFDDLGHTVPAHKMPEHNLLLTAFQRAVHEEMHEVSEDQLFKLQYASVSTPVCECYEKCALMYCRSYNRDDGFQDYDC